MLFARFLKLSNSIFLILLLKKVKQAIEKIWKMITRGELNIRIVITPIKPAILVTIEKNWSRMPQTLPLYQSIPSFALFIWSRTWGFSVHSKSIDIDCWLIFTWKYSLNHSWLKFFIQFAMPSKMFPKNIIPSVSTTRKTILWRWAEGSSPL